MVGGGTGECGWRKVGGGSEAGERREGEEEVVAGGGDGDGGGTGERGRVGVYVWWGREEPREACGMRVWRRERGYQGKAGNMEGRVAGVCGGERGEGWRGRGDRGGGVWEVKQAHTRTQLPNRGR